eukprot:6978195-Karenia_brevis.AAC.1
MPYPSQHTQAPPPEGRAGERGSCNLALRKCGTHPFAAESDQTFAASDLLGTVGQTPVHHR